VLKRRLREYVIAPGIAIVVTCAVFALIGGLLVLLEPRSPNAASSTSIISSGTTATVPGRYGSGTLGPWQNLLRRISPEDQIRDTLTFNGIFMFGDSIAVQDGTALEELLADRTGDSIAVHNWSGQPTSAAVDALADWSRTYGLPGRIVMAVGTNDIFDPPSFGAQVERAMAIAGPKPVPSGRRRAGRRPGQQRVDQPATGGGRGAPPQPADHPLGRAGELAAGRAGEVPARRRPHHRAGRPERAQ
jgi:hypothetical protein